MNKICPRQFCCNGLMQFCISLRDNEWAEIKRNPGGDGWVFVVDYRTGDIKHPVEVGWVIKGVHHCPFCGLRLCNEVVGGKE